MRLTLLRHGIAQIRDGIILDAKRKLTAKGIKRTQASLMGLVVCCMDVDLILSSPKLRALQTAEMASEILDTPMQIEQSLAQEDLSLIINALEHQSVEHLMLVGHEPTFTELAHYLCSTDSIAAKSSPFLVLKKAGALQMDIQRNGSHLRQPGTLQWLMQPGVLRLLGKSFK